MLLTQWKVNFLDIIYSFFYKLLATRVCLVDYTRQDELVPRLAQPDYKEVSATDAVESQFFKHCLLL